LAPFWAPLSRHDPDRNRLAWNLRHESVKNVPGLYVFGTLQGRRVVPGTYEVRITKGDESRSESLEVLNDPRVEATLAGFREQDELVQEIAAELEELHEGVIVLRSVRDQIEDLLKRAEDTDAAAMLSDEGEELVEQLTAMEDSLVQKRTVDGQTVINFPTRLNFHYTYLMGAVESAEGVVTDGARQMFGDLRSQWLNYKTQLNDLLEVRLAQFNSLVAESDVPAVIVPRP
jgi:hypothetical protein